MTFGLPNLNDIMSKVDATAADMAKLVAGMEKIAQLLEEQNEILRGRP